jgi:hypothetical protein
MLHQFSQFQFRHIVFSMVKIASVNNEAYLKEIMSSKGAERTTTVDSNEKRGGSSSPGVDLDDTEIAKIIGFDPSDTSKLETTLFSCINEDNRQLLLQIFELMPASTSILQILLTTTYPNRDNFYRHDQQILTEAEVFLGPSLEGLNAIQIATLLGEEDIAIDILEFVIQITEEIHARKVLYEFMGRAWGEGNTLLHLASFMGMTELVTRLIELGAATAKQNNNKYKPVDCACDDETRDVFETVQEGIRLN